MRTLFILVSIVLCTRVVHAEDIEQRRNSVLTGAFVGFDWRVLGLASHVSHGPGFQAGVVLWRHLRVGLAGFARPGPINPARFRVEAEAPYPGDSQLSLRSDGAFFGLMLGATFDLSEHLALELPVTVGQAAFGFYLTGEDRKTPDGRRVSEWENELLDGRDSSVTLGIDLGTRLVWRARPWLRPYVGVHYLLAPGYDSYVRSSYDGASGVLGVQLGRFE